MEIQANPDIEGLKLILYIAGPVMLIMLGVIGYFLKRQIDASVALTRAVNDLTIVVNSLQVQTNINTPVTEQRLNAHADQLDNHEKRITVIETEHSFYHKKKAQ